MRSSQIKSVMLRLKLVNNVAYEVYTKDVHRVEGNIKATTSSPAAMFF